MPGTPGQALTTPEVGLGDAPAPLAPQAGLRQPGAGSVPESLATVLAINQGGKGQSVPCVCWGWGGWLGTGWEVGSGAALGCAHGSLAGGGKGFSDPIGLRAGLALWPEGPRKHSRSMGETDPRSPKRLKPRPPASSRAQLLGAKKPEGRDPQPSLKAGPDALPAQLGSAWPTHPSPDRTANAMHQPHEKL